MGFIFFNLKETMVNSTKQEVEREVNWKSRDKRPKLDTPNSFLPALLFRRWKRESWWETKSEKDKQTERKNDEIVNCDKNRLKEQARKISKWLKNNHHIWGTHGKVNTRLMERSKGSNVAK